MTRRPSTSWFPAILLSMALAALTSCSSGKSGSAPTGPGAITTPELNSPDFGAGGMFQHRFTTAGTFGYHCVHHAAMTGNVVVSASAPDTVVNVNIVSSSMSFPAASVKPGGRVVWMNNTSAVHTVTSN
jgi:hypothetical protein